MRAPLKRYYLRSIIPLLVYAGMVVGSHFLAPLTALPWLKAVLALSPLLPFAWIFYYYFNYLAECDELERKIEMDAIAISAMSGVLSGMALLFLSDHALLQLSDRSIIVISVGAICLGYVITRYLGIWRFRA
jgi:prepilin signal peptidase PulO-like enzyme (type II secretory pathway)